MSGLFSNSSASSTTNATVGDISKDVALTTPPDDGISDISFSPQSEHLAVTSWDKKVRIYEINAQGGSEGKALYDHEQPVLSCCWSKVCVPGSYELILNEVRYQRKPTGWHQGCEWRCGQGCTHA